MRRSLSRAAARLLIPLALASTPLSAAAAPPAAPPGASLDAAAHARHLAAFETRRAAAGAAYDPRSAHLGPGGDPLYLNRLILEPSPYLRQHAHNAVDWRPWSDAALAEAQASGRPILLSVGYAACHWCHVMAAESFDDLEIAARLNRDFVPIKLDREEHPGLDETYLLATTLITGQSGWPNTVWLTPDGAPFFAATYLPRSEFAKALEAVAATWAEDRAVLEAAAAEHARVIEAYGRRRDPAGAIDAATHAAALAALGQEFDPLGGGFGDTVRFPMEVYLHYLLDRWRRAGDAQALGMATQTLDALLASPVHDHVGGGFHRYAVDPAWSEPHFEKMLYNQAEIARALIAAWEATGRPRYRRAAERALDYVLREMRAEDGGFFASEDAQSLDPRAGGKREGAVYLWTADEIETALAGAEDAQIDALKAALLTPSPFESGAAIGFEPEALSDLPALDPAFEALRRARSARPKPFRDEKRIAAWNGMAIRALAGAAQAFDRPDYAAAARRAADAVWTALWRNDALRRYAIATEPGGAESAADAPGALADYAELGLGLLALWDLGREPASGGPAFDHESLERARLLAEAIERRFALPDGRLKMAEQDGPLGPVLQQQDGATPSGESAALEFLARLARRGGGVPIRVRAQALRDALAGSLSARPADRIAALTAVALLQDGPSEPRQGLADGRVRAEARRRGDRLTVRLAIQEGWHVNAHEPLDAFLIPTRLDGAALSDASYPAPKTVVLGFSGKPLAVIDGVAEIEARLAPELGDAPAAARLTLQACSDAICLAPETSLIRLGPHPAK